jgi:hypothetical protein
MQVGHKIMVVVVVVAAAGGGGGGGGGGLEDSLPPLQVPATSSHFLKIHLNITLQSEPESSKVLFASVFRTKILHPPLLFLIRATNTAHIILPDLITLIIFGEVYISNISLHRFLQSLVTSLLLGSNIFPNTIILKILSLRSSPRVSDQFQHHTQQEAKL